MTDHNATTTANTVSMEDETGEGATFITRVVIENYRGITHADVRLGPLTFLVGRNGSGKSSFIDALHFMADGLRQTLDGAIALRDNMATISRLVGGVYQALGVRVEFRLPDGRMGSYGFEIAARSFGKPYRLQREECRLWVPGAEHDAVHFRVRDGQVESNTGPMPMALPNHLYLVNASGLAPFQDAYKALSAMRFYHLDSNRIRRSASAGEELILAEDGGNVAGILRRLAKHHPEFMQRVHEYLQVIVPDIKEAYAFEFGGQYTLAFRKHGQVARSSFGAGQMSDGTLRALAILLILFQQVPEDERFLSFISIEDPEAGLHRAAMAVLRDAFRDAAETTQVLVSTHSTDLLDAKDVDAAWIRVVVTEQGVTRIGPLSEATRSIVRDHLSTAGELLRTSPLRPLVSATAQAPAALFNE